MASRERAASAWDPGDPLEALRELEALERKTTASTPKSEGVSDRIEKACAACGVAAGGPPGGQTPFDQRSDPKIRDHTHPDRNTRGDEPPTQATARLFQYDRIPPRDNPTYEADLENWDGGELWMSLPLSVLEAARPLPLDVRDHGVFVLGLLCCATRIDEHGWRGLKRAWLDKRLGKCTRDGKQRLRSAVLLGSLEHPEAGLLHPLIERHPVYSPKHGIAQCYRLRDRTWLEDERAGREPSEANKRIGYVVTLYPSGRAGQGAGRRKHLEELPVPEYLKICYAKHTLDVQAAVRYLVEDIRAAVASENSKRRFKLPEPPHDFADRLIASDALEPWYLYRATLPKLVPPERRGFIGRPPKGMCKDLRERWGTALELIWTEYVNSKPKKHRWSRHYGRVFTPFVRLWAPLRRFVRFNDEPLVELDIKNAQPLFIAALVIAAGLGDLPAVREFVGQCEAGTLYEYAFDRLHSRDFEPGERPRFKVGFYSGWMFCKVEDMDKSEVGQAIRLAFPPVDAYVREQKKADYRAFACACQRFEASLMVDKLARVFAVGGLLPLTCHDAVYVPLSQGECAASVLQASVLGDLPVRATVVPKALA